MNSYFKLAGISSLFGFFVISLSSQTVPTAEQFASMRLSQAEKIIMQTNGGEAFSIFASAALNSKRIDLIALCFGKQGFCHALRDQVSELPESIFREQVTLLMLRERSPFWPSDNYSVSDEPRQIDGLWHEPFASLAKKYTPSISTSDDDLLSSANSRTQLAFKIEQAIKATNANKTRLPASQIANRDASSTLQPARIAPSNEAQSNPAVPTTVGLISSTPWSIIVVLTVAASGLLWLLLKNRK